MTGPSSFHRIYARNCEVRHIDKATAGAFLTGNHLYGDALCRYRYGLFVARYSGEENRPGAECHPYPVGTLVAVATFSNARHWNREDWSIRSCQWIRYASLKGVRVLGGMGKLLSAFVDEVKPDDVMTYAPLEHFTGEVYRTLGFVSEGVKTFGENSSEKFRLVVGRGRQSSGAGGSDIG